MKKKVIKVLVVIAIVLAAFIIQSTLSKVNSDIVATPNLMLIVVCIFGFMRGSNYGSVIGLCCGLLVDFSYGDIIGLYAFLYMICGFFSGTLKRLFYSENVLMPLVLVFTNDFIYNLAVYIFRFLLRNKQDFPYYFWNRIFPEMIITTFIMFLTFKLFYILNEKLFMTEEERSLTFDK
ncbi:MAG: rod shape-determining protein MreD [Eubacterium sp.]|nr:rod shape-determining protein MreD [Eubacterium sp.]